jgi:hypothetical protein
MINVDELRNKK